jgi:hypothetical protein
MQDKKTSESDFSSIVARIKDLQGYKKDYEVGEMLGLDRKALSWRKTNNSIPLDKIRLYCSTYSRSLDFVLYGIGNAAQEGKSGANLNDAIKQAWEKIQEDKRAQAAMIDIDRGEKNVNLPSSFDTEERGKMSYENMEMLVALQKEKIDQLEDKIKTLEGKKRIKNGTT